MHRNLRKHILHLLFIMFFLSVFPTGVLATTLAQYREKVSRAYDTLDYLEYPEEDLSAAENRTLQRDKIKEIRASLPAADRIELPNGSFDVDNRWLHEKLNQFESESFDSPNREKILGELSDKLAALESKLTELETQSAANRTKDEDKQKLGEILKRPEYQKPAQSDKRSIAGLIEEFFNWLAKVFPKTKYGEASETSAQSFKPFLQVVVFLVAFALIGFLLYRFAPVLFKSFRNREKAKKETRVILGETLAADETSQNLFSEAENLARQGDLRAAIRKGYIAFLCELSDRKIIGLARHKTNRDYLRDVSKRDDLHREMSGLTANFERHWYGFETTGKEDWEAFRKQYREAVGKSA